MKSGGGANVRKLALLAITVIGFGSANAAPPLPSLDTAVFAKQSVRLGNGISGQIVSFPSHSPKEWADLLDGEPGAPVELIAQIFRPNVAREKLPAVILVPGSGGLAPHHLRQAAELTTAGFVVMLIGPFGGRGISGTIADQGRLSWPASTYDVAAAFRYLVTRRDIDPEAIGAVGSSRGGTAVLMAAMEPISQTLLGPGEHFRALVVGYPWFGVQFRNARLTAGTALLVMSGDHDDWVSLQQCQGAVQALSNRGQNVRLMIFPGALHAFDRAGVPPTEIPDAPTSTTFPTVFMDDTGRYFDLRHDLIDPELTSDDFKRAAIEGGFVRTGVTIGTQEDQADEYIVEMVRFLQNQFAPEGRRAGP